METYFNLSEVHPTTRKVVCSKVQGYQIQQNVSKWFMSYYAYNTMKNIFSIILFDMDFVSFANTEPKWVFEQSFYSYYLILQTLEKQKTFENIRIIINFLISFHYCFPAKSKCLFWLDNKSFQIEQTFIL